MKLVIAEKPMLARDIARAICGKSVSETARLPISGNGYTVCACAGHLLELVDPSDINADWGTWIIEQLPIAVDNWPKAPAAGKESLVENIGELLADADEVINAGDPDDEGQLIVDEVLEYLGYKGKVSRVYVNDNIEKNIVKAFNDLKDNRDCMGAGLAAYARQMADMCFGINETRLATKRLGTKLTVGRVQTPTLGLVVTRDELIESHTKQTYYELFVKGKASKDSARYDVCLKFEPQEDLLADGKHLLDKRILEEIAAKIGGSSFELALATRDKKEHPPLPFNLTTLTSEMSKRFKFSAQKTLDVTQALRDKYKAITYNRSDSQYLKDEHFDAASVVLGQAMKNCNVAWDLDFSIKSKAFNEKNVTAHHGIIPQEVAIDIEKMTADEQKVYRAIVERYAMQFMPPALWAIQEGIVNVADGALKYSAKELKEEGFLAFAKNNDTDAKNDSDGWMDGDSRTDGFKNSVIEDGTYSVEVSDCEICAKQTTPPKRYTEGTLIADMASIAKYVQDDEIKAILKQKDDGKKGENGGIGTTATRAAIIEKLKKIEYLKEEKGKLISTQKARDFYRLLPNEIKAADTTAKWWLIQQDIAEGKQDVNAIQQSVVEVFNNHKQTAYANAKLSHGKKRCVGTCPICGEPVIASGKIYKCSSNKNVEQEDGTWKQVSGCGFKMFQGFGKKKFTDSQVSRLLERKEVLVKELKSKTNTSYDAYLVLDLEKVNDIGFYGCKVSSFPEKARKAKK